MIKKLAIVERELKLSFSFGSASYLNIIFLILSVTIFSVSLGGDLNLLSRVGIYIIWILFLFTSMLSLDKLYLSDFYDGSLHLLFLKYQNHESLVLIKALTYWGGNITPIIATIPFIAVLLSLDLKIIPIFLIVLVISTIILTLLSSIGSCFLLTLDQKMALFPIIVFPLYIPVLIFSISIIDSYANDIFFKSQILFLLGMLLLLFISSPLITTRLLISQLK